MTPSLKRNLPRRTALVGWVTFALLALPAAALAQPADGGVAEGPPPGHGHGHGHDIEQMIRTVTERVQLSPDKAAQVERIMRETARRMRELHQGPRGPEMRTQARQLHWDAEDRIHAILSCEGRERMRVLMREHRARKMERAHSRRGDRQHRRRHRRTRQRQN